MRNRIQFNRMSEPELRAEFIRTFGHARRMPENKRVLIARLAGHGKRSPKMTPEEFVASTRAAAAGIAPCEHGVSYALRCAKCEAEKDLISRIESGSVDPETLVLAVDLAVGEDRSVVVERCAHSADVSAGCDACDAADLALKQDHSNDRAEAGEGAVEDLIGEPVVDPIAEATAKLKQARRK